jgi:stage III sporulation protein AE
MVYIGRKIYRAAVILVMMLLAVILFSGYCFAQEDHAQEDRESTKTGLIEQQSDASGVQTIKHELERYIDDENNEILQGFSPEELISNLTAGDMSLDLKGIGANALRFLFRELYLNLGIFIRLTLLAVVCALLKNLKVNFLGESAGQVAFYVCYIVIVSILLVSYGTVVKMGTDIIDKMVGFMYVTIPVMMALLISGGNITTGGILHPVLLLIVEGAVTLIKNIFIPLVFLSTILKIVNNISDKIQLAKLANLLKQIVSWTLATILTVFVIAISLQGTLGAVIDGVTSKAAKFAISTFIPIVGKTLADATDTVIGCTLLIKNAASVAALVGILVICIVPLIKIIAMVALYKAASALLEPISEKRITNCIDDVAGSMLHIFALAAAVAFMFMVSITALISAGNVSAMLR